MRACVLDASVAAKWFFPGKQEPHADDALALLKKYTEGALRFLVPSLYWPEAANILWKSAHLGRITPAVARDSFSLLQQVSFRTDANQTQAASALSIALAYNCSVYDCTYIALAIDSGSWFVTADERLVHAVSDRLPVSFLPQFAALLASGK